MILLKIFIQRKNFHQDHLLHQQALIQQRIAQRRQLSQARTAIENDDTYIAEGGQNYISSLTCAALAAAVSSDRMSSVPGRRRTPLPVRDQLPWISSFPQSVWPRWRKDQWWTSPWSWDAETWRRNVWARCWGWGSCWGSQACPSWWWGTPACSASESGTWRIPTSVKRMWKLVYWRSILHHRYRFYWLALLESL